MKSFLIYWTCSREARILICKRFGISIYLTINGETSCTISEEDMPLFMQTRDRGFFKLRNKKTT